MTSCPPTPPRPGELDDVKQPAAQSEHPASRSAAWPFSGPSVLAPMEGVSHPAFRDLMVDLGGLHLVCTEFVRITDQPPTNAHLVAQVSKSKNCPLSVQVMGNNAEQMADAARTVARAGADVVDINLGCPMPRVVRKGVGAAMLKNPRLLQSVLQRMRAATTGLLSAKLRAGYDDSGHALELARLVESCGVDFITVHPRRRCDFYSGVADWRIIAELKATLRIPVVGNGDVWYAEDALRMQSETGCDAVMIGRPALRNPWIFKQIEALSHGVTPFQPCGADIVAHLRHVADRYSELPRRNKTRAVGPFKELVRWIGRAVDDGGTFCQAALRLATIEQILLHAQRRLAPMPASVIDLQARPTLRLERSGGAQPVRMSA